MGFFTIFVPDGLSERDYRRALGAGPSFVSSRRREHSELILAAGFQQADEVDLTGEFLTTSRAWYTGRERYREELAENEGLATFDEKQRDTQAQIAATESGLLRRALFICW